MATAQVPMSHNTPTFGVVFILGGPGAGKGALCSSIASHYNMIHLSAGELLRKEMNTPGSKVAAEIETYIKSGTIVPVAITCSLLHKFDLTKRNRSLYRKTSKYIFSHLFFDFFFAELKAMLEGYSRQNCVNYLVDGFPRNEDNKSGWEATMSDKTKVIQVIVIDCPENVCIERCLHRGSGRIDDNEQTLKNRITQFKTEGLPVIEYYTEKGLVTHLDGTKSKEDVFQQARDVLDRIM